MKAQCGVCARQLCVSGRQMEAGFCPQQIHPELYPRAIEIYKTDGETALMHKNAAIVEAKGYIAWPRLRDTIEFCREMSYETLGLVYCPDLSLEVVKTASILEENGFNTISVPCGLCADEEEALERHEAGDPRGFTEEINAANPDIIVTVGLCVAAEALAQPGDPDQDGDDSQEGGPVVRVQGLGAGVDDAAEHDRADTAHQSQQAFAGSHGRFRIHRGP